MVDHSSPRIGIVTGERAPELTDDGQALRDALRERGWSARSVVWTNDVDLASLDVALLRSCWQYHERPDAFREWLDAVEAAGVRLLNSPDVVRWNVHKFYLRDLADAGVPVLPTAFVESGTDRALVDVLRERGWDDAVVKPAVGTSSVGVWRTDRASAADDEDRFASLLADGDVLVQQFASEVRDGERSFVFLGGAFSHARTGRPAPGDFRTHPDFDGTNESWNPPAELVQQARTVLEPAAAVLGVERERLSHARVDGVERDGEFHLMELELVEPYLGLREAGAVDRLAGAVESALRAAGADHLLPSASAARTGRDLRPDGAGRASAPRDAHLPIGLGTYENTDPETCANAVAHALDVGYRHVDTAEMYDNEAYVAEGIERSAVPASEASGSSSERSSDGVDREDVFLATKVHSENLAYEDVLASARASADRLGVDALDLLYVHWPIRAYDPDETLAAFDELYDEGLIRHVGVSNFRPDQLEAAIETLDAPLFAHQVECHVLLQQDELRRLAREHGHYLVAYSPLAKGDVTEVPELQEIAAARDATAAQVALAWLRAKGVVPIPKAASESHIEENLAATDLGLSEEEVARIDAVDRVERKVDFEGAPWNR